jgi:glycosyltransferase involved in cell wall biosynthesis
MKILLDNIIFSLQKTGGISVYWTELTRRLLSDGEFDYQCYEMKNATSNFFRATLEIDPEKIIQEKEFFAHLNRLFYVIKFTKEPYIFHSSYYRPLLTNRNACVVTTIHDFTPEIIESGWKKRGIAAQKYNSIKNSDLIICVSQNTKKDLLRLYPEFSKKRIEVIYNGVNEAYKPLNKNDFSIKDKFPEVNLPYCIFIGKRDGYKNFKFAVEYLATRKHLFLVIVGGGELSKSDLDLLNCKLPNRYTIRSFLSTEDLNLLYNFAEFLFYPSDYEGFGIPIIEAQKSGCPVIAQRTSSIEELIPDKNLLFTTLNFDSIEMVRSYIENNKEKIVYEGIENAKHYTWDKTYEQHKDLYCTLYHKKFD